MIETHRRPTSFPLLEDAEFDALDAHISRGRGIVSDVRGPVPAKKALRWLATQGLRTERWAIKAPGR